MALATRSYDPSTDRQQVRDLLAASRAATHRPGYLTAHRLDVLLTSRLWEPERDARLWRDGDACGLAGFAMLWRRSRERREVTLEWIAAPDTAALGIDAHILDWARLRCVELARELGQPVSLIIVSGEHETSQADMLRQREFTAIEDHPVRMRCALPANPLSAPLPEGFALRRLDAGADLTAYAALYDQAFSPVSADHRSELLRDPEYAYFVAAAPDGRLVAFCECSISRAEWALGGVRGGEIDYLGTLEGFQRRGLGSALLSAALGQLRQWGAGEASLITGGTNEHAQRVYRRVGMAIVDRATVYSLEMVP